MSASNYLFHESCDVLPSAGLGAVSSYGAISNVTYGGGLAVAWIAFVRQFHKSPLMAGQWKAFVAFYAGEEVLISRTSPFNIGDGKLVRDQPSNKAARFLICRT